MYQCAYCTTRADDLGLMQGHLLEAHHEDLLRKNETWYDAAERAHVIHHHDFGFLIGIADNGQAIWSPDINQAHNFPTIDLFSRFVQRYRKVLNDAVEGARFAGVDQRLWEYVPITALRMGDTVYEPWLWAGYEGTVTQVASPDRRLVEIAWHKWQNEDMLAYECRSQWRRRDAR